MNTEAFALLFEKGVKTQHSVTLKIKSSSDFQSLRVPTQIA